MSAHHLRLGVRAVALALVARARAAGAARVLAGRLYLQHVVMDGPR